MQSASVNLMPSGLSDAVFESKERNKIQAVEGAFGASLSFSPGDLNQVFAWDPQNLHSEVLTSPANACEPTVEIKDGFHQAPRRSKDFKADANSS